MAIILTGNELGLDELWRVAVEAEEVELHPQTRTRVIKCRDYIEQLIAEGKKVYGLTTGFGKFSNIRIPDEQLEELQENLILSHAAGVGPYLSIPETRAVMLLRINVLAKGLSGIRLSTLEALIELLNRGVHPCIPEQGSVGASGDLAPLSHLVLVLLGKGYAIYQNEILPGEAALQKIGLSPIKLQAKEGLALNNGTQVMTALTSLSLHRAWHLCQVADLCAAVTVDSLKGTTDAFDPLLHQARPFAGQIASAKNIRLLLAGSPLRESHRNCDNVQDPYSLRCSPQVHGAVRDCLDFIRQQLEIEINSATDNPLIFPEEGKVLSGGNFHGEPIAIAADLLGIVTAELASISERRIEQLLNPALNRGLHPFLAPRPGLDSGFMIAQVTAASLVSENKILAHPAVVDSIPTSANQEDHVSMGMTAAVKARKIIENTAYVLAIELMISLQALENREHHSSEIIERIRAEVRKIVNPLTRDRILNSDINKMKEFIESEIITTLLEEKI